MGKYNGTSGHGLLPTGDPSGFQRRGKNVIVAFSWEINSVKL